MDKEQFYPSNGTEGMLFEANNCYKCYKRHSCSIMFNALLGKHPKQWKYNKSGKPICISLQEERPNKIKRTPKSQLKLF